MNIRPSDTPITPLQLGTLTLLMLAGTTTLDVPRTLSTTAAQQSAWTTVPLAGLFGYAVWFLVSRLAARFPGETIIEYSPRVLGAWLGKTVGMLYIFSVLIGLTVITREFTDFVLVTSLPKTPISVVIAFILVVKIVAARNGIEVLGRLAFVLTPIAITVVFGVIAFGTTSMSLGNVLPVWPHGMAPPMKGSLEAIGFFGGIYNLALLYPFANDAAKARRAALVWFTVLVVITLVATLGVNATFSELSGRYTYPLFSFGRVAGSGPVAFRLDVFIVALEMLGLAVQAAIWLFVSNYALSQWLGLAEANSVLIPVSLAVAALAGLQFATRTEVLTWLTYILPVRAILFQFGIPALLLMTAALRGTRAAPPPGSSSEV